MDGKPNGHGIDVFAYLKSSDGWKLAALHNTVVVADDKNDYSKSYPLKGEVTAFPSLLATAIKQKQKYVIQNLFHSGLSPVINLDYGDDFSYFHNSAAGLADRVGRSNYELAYDFSNIKAQLYDQYITVLTMDFTAKVNGELRVSGKQLWLLYATTNSDWRISSMFYHSN